MTGTTADPTLSVSAAAARRISEIVAGEDGPRVLRLAVLGGGCSGFSYDFALEGGPGTDDLVINRDGATVVVDPMSLPFLEGAELDFVDNLMGRAFKVNNPNATSTCGCGASFSI